METLRKFKKLRLSPLRIFPYLFFPGLFLTGLLVYKDYGISWDEEFCRDRALVSANYIIQNFFPQFSNLINNTHTIPQLHEYQNKDYGVVFELPILILEKLLGLDYYSNEAFFLRHLCIYTSYVVGIFFFYFIVKQRLNSTYWALLGTAALVLSPRIFADAFYNSKDIVFMSAFCIATYTLLKFLQTPAYKTAFFHALACSIAIDIRITGIILPATTILFFILQTCKDCSRLKQKFLIITTYALFLILFTIAFWPLLWDDPLHNFISSFQSMSKFRFNKNVFYLGEMILAPELPWHYLPIWIIISTPVMYIVSFFIGLAYIIKQIFLEKLFRSEDQKQNLIFLTLFTAPLIAIWVFNSVVYDAWRQVFFIYPSFIAIGLIGLYNIWHNPLGNSNLYKLFNIAIYILFAINLIHTLYFMIKAHPHQNVYFSIISGENASKNFERDYWGLSYKQGLEFILRTDTSATIKYHSANVPGQLNKWILPKNAQERLQLVPFEEATYFLSEYRWHPQTYPLQHEIFYIEIDNLKIMSVFKLK